MIVQSFALLLSSGVLFASRARLIEKLLEGDPVAWIMLLAALGLYGIWHWFKSRRKKREMWLKSHSRSADANIVFGPKSDPGDTPR